MQQESLIQQAVILAGGKGERLRPITNHVPKPMAPVLGKPYLDYLLHSLQKVGIKRVLLLLGYKAEVVQAYYDAMHTAALKIEYSVGSPDDQTGRRIINAYNQLDNHFLLLYGDNYWPIELEAMTQNYLSKKAKVSTTVFTNQFGTAEYGPENNIEVEPNGFVKRYDKSRKSSGLSGVDIGYFIVDKSALPVARRDNFSFEEDFLPELITKQELVAHRTAQQYYFITNPECLANFEKTVLEKQFQAI